MNVSAYHRAALTLAAFSCTFLTLRAIPCIPSGAVLTTTLDLVVDAPDSDGPLPQTQGSIWHIQESIWMTSSGGTGISIDATSFFITGTGGGIDQTSWAEVVDVLAIEGIEQAIDSGYVHCGDTVTILTPSCVTRVGAGVLTWFLPCGIECCTRSYLVACPEPGIVQILRLPITNPPCEGVSSGCESGCDTPPFELGMTEKDEITTRLATTEKQRQ